MNIKYLIFTASLLFIEILIAIFVHDGFIRPFFGDYLATIFVYCSIRIFNKNIFQSVVLSLFISYFIETLQFFKFIEITGLIKYKVLAVLIGKSISWLDIVAYTLGFMSIITFENFGLINFLVKNYSKKITN